MKKLFFIWFTVSLNAQTAFQNFGSLQMHSNAEVGFHTDLINDGTFENNQGLAGFYSDDETRIISGANRAVFYNVDIDALNNVELQTALGVSNTLSFINGKIFTNKHNLEAALDFINHDFYIGEDHDRHVDGYSSVLGANSFTFPVGDDNRLRPMSLPSHSQESYFKGAYFYEDPNNPSTFSQDFLTHQKQIFIERISQIEFWDLIGTEQTMVTLTWDDYSNIATLSNNINQLRVVGWSKTEQQWVDLGNSDVAGDIYAGEITSNPFIPDLYEVITIGSGITEDSLDNVNILFSPNNDGIGDTLVFEGLEQYPENSLKIYNRWGVMVYETVNYTNDWEGTSHARTTMSQEEKLPVGTYFYVLTIETDSLSRSKPQTGWIYIQR